MGNEQETKEVQIRDSIFKLKFDIFAPITVSLPALSLLVCFVSAMIFQFDEVNLTMCKVKNYIPSISAVTGATPQRYIWRTCIGLHATPRYAVGVMYYNYYMSRISFVPEAKRACFKRLASITFWVYTVENSCLLLVSVVANYENYPVHEKIFVVFMFTSMFHQLFVLLLFSMCHPQMSPQIQSSVKQKKIYFALCLFSTATLVYFFIQHRFFCAAGAFSWFSLSEYGIAYFNIGFHYTAKQDFAGYEWFIGRRCRGNDAATNGNAITANGAEKKTQ